MFNALHGTPGEDGTVQGMMDLMGLTYTHSGLETSVIAIDKELTKMALVPHGIRMPAGTIVESESLFQETRCRGPMSEAGQRRLVGRSCHRHRRRQLRQPDRPRRRRARGSISTSLLAEPFIKGRELTVAVLNDEPLAVTELKPNTGFYDYEPNIPMA